MALKKENTVHTQETNIKNEGNYIHLLMKIQI